MRTALPVQVRALADCFPAAFASTRIKHLPLTDLRGPMASTESVIRGVFLAGRIAGAPARYLQSGIDTFRVYFQMSYPPPSRIQI